MRNRNLVIFFQIFMILVFIGIGIAVISHESDYVVTVTDLVVKNSSDSSKYLVFSEMENGKIRVFKNTDNIFKGKMNSSDVQAGLKVGKKYRFRVYGYRVNLFSWYENIVEIEEIQEADNE